MAAGQAPPPARDLSMSGTPRAGKERREGDSIYHSHPIPAMPPLVARPRLSGDSMLAYTERMRQISQSRAESAEKEDAAPDSSALEIQARHIPKFPGPLRQGDRKPPPPRRPLSLDELTGRRGGKVDKASATGATKRADRCMSEPPVRMPSVAGDKEKEERRIRINFVSAADLFDLVDFGLHSRRSDHVQLARVEDTLRLIRQANFFRSSSNRRRLKPVPEREPDVDTASLIVQGTSSPRGSSRESKGAGDKEGDWARNEVPTYEDPYDSDDEDEEDDDRNYVDLDFDLLEDRRRLLLQPPKLHFRPKRAKRMRLHRSLLSAIPEDDSRFAQRPDNRPALAEDSSVRVHVIPTASSLAAIKGARDPDTLTFPETRTSITSTDNACRTSGDEPSLPHPQPVDRNEIRTTKKSRQKKHAGGVERGLPNLSADSEHRDQIHTKKADDHVQASKNVAHVGASKKKVSPRGTVPGITTSSLSGRSVFLETPDRRHKKIRKIIFLRDLPEHPSHRS